MSNWSSFKPYSLRAVLRRFPWYGEVLSLSPNQLKAYWRELQSDKQLARELTSTYQRASPKSSTSELGASIAGGMFRGRLISGGPFSFANAELYTLVRGTRSMTVVETGVAAGVSSALILAALIKNGGGRLVSIDLPNPHSTGYSNLDGVVERVWTPASLGSGWIVPSRLRSNWNLKLGSSVDLLGPSLEELGEIDFFFHDSEHSFSNMKFEFELAWPHIRQGGVLYADDVSMNEAFQDFFAAEHGEAVGGTTPAYRGLMRKKRAS